MKPTCHKLLTAVHWVLFSFVVTRMEWSGMAWCRREPNGRHLGRLGTVSQKFEKCVYIHMRESQKKRKTERQREILLLLSHFSRVRLCATPIDGSPPGSPVPGILQARTLEWVVISFSNE